VDWDDLENFTTNPAYRGLAGAQLAWMWTTFLLGHYVPIAWMTLGLDYLAWGMNPAGYHLTNVLLHVANAVVFYLVASCLIRAAMSVAVSDHPLAWRLSAAFAALIFAVHPLRVESVAWITERRDVLSGLFFLLTVLAYLRDADAPSGVGLRRRRWYWVALGCFVLALLSKAIVVTLPIVLVVLDVYPLRRLGSAAGGWWTAAARHRWAEKIPFVVASAVVTPLAFIAARSGANLVSVADVGLLDRLAISSYGLTFYLWKTVAPLELAPFYPLVKPIRPLSAPHVASGLVVVALTAAAVVLRHRWPAFAAGWIVYTITLLPVSGVFQNGPQIAADRYSYLPSLAPAMLAGAGSFAVLRPWCARKRGPTMAFIAAGVAALVVATLALLSWRQVGVWRDSERLWTHALSIAPSSVVHSHLADLRRRQGRWTDAHEHYRQAASMRPGGVDIQINWGIALAQQGRLGAAVDRYREALRLAPHSAAAHYHWGNALFTGGELEEAIAHYREAVRIDAGAAEAYSNWGRALALQGKRDEAITKFREALAIRPHSVPHYNWGNALFAAGNLEEAIAHYREAVRIDPNAAEAYNNWGRALAQQRKWDDAIGMFRAALRIRPDYPLASANLEHALVQRDGASAR
jgi:protein O-mannosyl-transferase